MSNGSPIPIRTTLVTRSPSARRMRAKWSTWATISPAVRSRRNPAWPVAQKAQPIGQPTWVETQTVRRRSYCISTTSTVSPSRNRSRSFRVCPSDETWVSTTSGAPTTVSSASRRRSALGRLVIWSKSSARWT